MASEQLVLPSPSGCQVQGPFVSLLSCAQVPQNLNLYQALSFVQLFGFEDYRLVVVESPK